MLLREETFIMILAIFRDKTTESIKKTVQLQENLCKWKNEFHFRTITPAEIML